MIASTPAHGLLPDLVPDNALGARALGFNIPARYNASAILFDNLSRGSAGKVAIRCASGDATYAALCAKAAQIGRALLARGLGPGERVLLMLDDTADYPACLFGALRAGLVPVLLNTLSPPDLLRFYAEDSGARAVLTSIGYDDRFTDATLAGTSVETVIVVDAACADVGGSVARVGASRIAEQVTQLDAAPTGRDDMAFWLYSSGTSGRPKGVVHLQHDMAYAALGWPRATLGMTADDVCFSVPKIFFAYGLGNSLVFPFSVGATAVLHPGRPEPAAIWACLAKHAPTLFFALPTVYRTLLQDPHAPSSLDSLRLCLSAAETLTPELFAAWRERFGHEIVEGVGSTEALHIYISNRPGDVRPGKAGFAVPGYEMQLMTPDGEPVPDGSEGVLWVRGHSSAPCYWNRPDKTAETMRDGWLRTGDRMVRDDEGCLTFLGRADELIKISGQWVHPLEIENCLQAHAAVRECAVLAVEQPDGGMTTQALIVLHDGYPRDTGTAAMLKAHVKASLLPYKYPRIVTFVDTLPKTGTDKIDRQSLRARSAETGIAMRRSA